MGDLSSKVRENPEITTNHGVVSLPIDLGKTPRIQIRSSAIACRYLVWHPSPSRLFAGRRRDGDRNGLWNVETRTAPLLDREVPAQCRRRQRRARPDCSAS